MRVVIVGGGVAGHLLAYRLQHRCQVTLVDPREHFTVPMALPRLWLEPDGADRATLPWAAFLPAVAHRPCRAVGVDRELQLSDGGRLAFDVLVIAVGRHYPGWEPAPGLAAWRSQLQERASDLRGSAPLTLVGGGPVGVELAGELVDAGRGPRVQLFEAGSSLIPEAGPAAAARARRWLEQRGVSVHLGTRWEGVASRQVISCRVGAPATAWLAGSGVLDAAGRVRVGPSLEVLGQPPASGRWFALGDCTDRPEAGLGAEAARHAEALARTLSGQPTPCPSPSRPGRLVVTLGRGAAVGRIPWVPSWLVSPLGSWFKGRDLLVGRYRKRLGLPA